MNEMRTLDKQNSQSGQVVVEYILLLVIAIALILGLANQLSKPFSAWMKDYMGQYVECLLDMGELPTVGGSSDSGECNSKFKSFSVSEGRPPISNKNSDDESTSSKSPRSPSSDDTASSPAGSSSRSGRGRSQGFPIGKNAGADGPGSELGDKQMTEPIPPQSQFFKFHSTSSSAVSSGPGGAGSNQSLLVPLKQPKAREGGEKSVKVTTDVESGDNTHAKKLVITPPERKVASEEADQPWGFGQYMKFALILLIIIAIVLFLGGQILQISKSMEK